MFSPPITAHAILALAFPSSSRIQLVIFLRSYRQFIYIIRPHNDS